MNKEAVFHLNTEAFIYPTERNQLVVKIRTAKKEILRCSLIYWNRTDNYIKEEQLDCAARDGLFDYFQGTVVFPKVARYQKYYFSLEERNGTQWYYSADGISTKKPESGYFEYLYANGNDVITHPKWAEGAVYYQIFPERFNNGRKENDPKDCMPWGTLPTRENYMGGDLFGIIEKIPYLKRLHVDCIYLNPIFKGDFNHKYATTDYFQIDPEFGTKEDLKQLTARCHEAGIRVLLDGVFNHTGIHFEHFQDVLKKQEQSAYKDWFLISSFPMDVTHHDYECVGAYKWMPKLNSANREVRQFIIQVMDYWIRECNIDGWRLDVADEVDKTVWRQARLELKEKYPDILLMGETWGYGGSLVDGSQMDTVMNYMFRDAVKDYFAEDKITAVGFDERINHMLGLYRSDLQLILYNLLDSHDTERMLHSCQEELKRMKLAVAFQMLFIGSPAIYYGDEIGMTGSNDPDCRRCMEWDEKLWQGELFKWYEAMLRLRKEHTAISKGGYYTIIADSQTDTFGFLRKTQEEVLYVILHKGQKECETICPVLEAGGYQEMLLGETYQAEKMTDTDSFYNEDITCCQAAVKMKMSPYSIKVIRKREENHYEKRK